MTISLGYPGQYYDGDGWTVYNWQRYYMPQYGRYLQADPLTATSVQSVGEPTSAELPSFAYAGGRPVLYTDPSGELPGFPVVVGCPALPQLCPVTIAVGVVMVVVAANAASKMTQAAAAGAQDSSMAASNASCNDSESKTAAESFAKDATSFKDKCFEKYIECLERNLTNHGTAAHRMATLIAPAAGTSVCRTKVLGR